jgi:phage terminase small subunit
MPIPAVAPLLPRQELFAYHVACGASLAQAARLVGYSPNGARQRGSLLMANDRIRIRMEQLRRSRLAEREKRIGEAVAEVAQVIDTALRLDHPAAAIKALELKLKLQGVIPDPRFNLANSHRRPSAARHDKS